MGTCTQCHYTQKGTLILERTSFGVRVAVQEVWCAVGGKLAVGNNLGMIGRGNLPEDDWTLETIWGLLHMAGDDWTWEIKHLWNRTMTVELLNRRTRGHLSSYDKGGTVLI